MTAQVIQLPIIARPIPGNRLEQIASEIAAKQGLPHEQRWKVLVQAGYALLQQERDNAGSGRAAK